MGPRSQFGQECKWCPTVRAGEPGATPQALLPFPSLSATLSEENGGCVSAEPRGAPGQPGLGEQAIGVLKDALS